MKVVRGIRNQQPFFVTEQDEDGEETGEDVTRDYSWNVPPGYSMGWYTG